MADMRKAIITGANGFLGRKLTECLLANEYDVTAIVHERVEALDAFKESTCLRIVRSVEVDQIPASDAYEVFYNLAWRGSGGPLRANYNVQLDNVKAALDYYALARRLGCRRFICTGTIGEKMVVLPECKGIRSQNFVYVNCKACLLQLLRALETPDTCKVIWATLGNVYGIGDQYGNLVSYTIRTLLEGKEAEFGPADQIYDFVFADECVQALMCLGSSPRLVSDTFYVGSGRPAKLADLLKLIGRVFGREELVCIGRRPDDGTRYLADWFSIKALETEAGYVPAISLEEGVRRTLETIKQERHA